MAYEGVMGDIRACVALKKPRRIPVFALSEEFDVKWYGKYTYDEVIQSADKLVEVWGAAVREFDYDWAWLQMDDCIEFEVLGVGCLAEPNIVRATHDYLPATWETVKSLKLPDHARDGRMPVKLEALRRLKTEFGDTLCVVGSNAAPYSSAGLLFGLQTPMMPIYDKPDLLRDTMDFFVELQSRWGIAQIKAGADAIWLGDCNAFSGLLSATRYQEFAAEPCRKVIQAIQSAGGMVFLHNSEVSIPHIELECGLKPDVVSVGPGADLEAVFGVARGKTCIMGNIDPIEVLLRGTPPQVEKEVERVMSIGCAGTGFMLDSGEAVPRDAPVENMRATMRRGHELAVLQGRSCF
jgi:uroporphyrinogen decarboxylase